MTLTPLQVHPYMKRLSLLRGYPHSADKIEALATVLQTAQSQEHLERVVRNFESIETLKEFPQLSEFRRLIFNLREPTEPDLESCPDCGGTGYISRITNGFEHASPCHRCNRAQPPMPSRTRSTSDAQGHRRTHKDLASARQGDFGDLIA